MIKRVYSHLLLLASIVCYIAVFTHLGTSVQASDPVFPFGITISTVNLFSIITDIVIASYFVEAGTVQDVYHRQRVVLLLVYTFFYTFVVLFFDRYWYVVPAILHISVGLHRGATEPDVVPTLIDITLVILWIIFLLEIL